MGTNALILGLAIAALPVVGCGGDGGSSSSNAKSPPADASNATTAGAPSAALSKDPCALLKTAEIQALIPNAPVSSGVSSTASELGFVQCEYNWGAAGNAYSVTPKFTVSLTDASRAYPGTSSAMIKEGLLLIVKAGAVDTAVISGVGEAAIFESPSPNRAETTAYVQGVLLKVDFVGLDARSKKDQVIALLKSAAARL